MSVFIAKASYTKEGAHAIGEMQPFAAKLLRVGAENTNAARRRRSSHRARQSAERGAAYAPPLTEPCASAETETDTLMFAWMLIAALTAAAT